MKSRRKVALLRNPLANRLKALRYFAGNTRETNYYAVEVKKLCNNLAFGVNITLGLFTNGYMAKMELNCTLLLIGLRFGDLFRL